MCTSNHYICNFLLSLQYFSTQSITTQRTNCHHSLHIRVQRIYFYSIFIWLTLFSLYFSILRTIYFLTFFDSRPPSFAKLTFCKLKFSKKAVGTKIGHFLSEYFLGTSCMPLQRKVKGFFHIYDDSKLAP